MSSFVRGLRCRECGAEYPVNPVHVCEFCFGPLEVVYDYEGMKGKISRESIESRPQTMWRYRELLPVDQDPTVGRQVGWTPLVHAKRLGKKLGLNHLYIKFDGICYPTLSFKDRVVSVALSKAVEFGVDTVACAATGNLANSVAANAAASGLKSYVFIPHDLEQGKVLGSAIYGTNTVGIKGSYDEVNRLCSEIAGNYGWGFVNINLRPFYAEGSKSLAFESFEQLGWRIPDHFIAPMASGSLLTKIWKAREEMIKLGLTADTPMKMHGAQADGCGPIVRAVEAGTELIKPERPSTIAKSLAIGNPADGFYAQRIIRESGGDGALVNDDEIVEAMRLVAETEGLFTETAGGVTIGTLVKLAERGRFKPDEVVVVAITGNGLKTQEAIADKLQKPTLIEPKLAAFDAIMQG